jgi:hypothetical protein
MIFELLYKNKNTRFFLGFLFFLSSFISINAATRTSTTLGGVWTAGTTWVGGIAPVAGDNVIISTTGTNSVTLGANASITNVTISTGGTLDVLTRTLTATGTFVNNGIFKGTTGRLTLTGTFTNSGVFTLSTGRLTVSAGAISNTGSLVFTGAGRLVFGGNYSNSGTVTLSSTQVQFTGTANQSIGSFTTTGAVSMLKMGGIATFIGNINGGGITINGTGGVLNLGMSLTHTFTGTWAQTAGTLNGGSSVFKIGINANATGGTFIAGTGTVEYFRAAANQTVAPFVYNNLTISGTGTKTAASSPTVNGILSMEGTTSKIVVTNAPVVTYGPNATLRYNKAGAYTATSEEWITSFNGSGGVVIANVGTITLNAAKVFNTAVPLTINNGAKLTTNNFGLTFGGNFINNGGLFTAGSSPIIINNTMTSQSIAGFTTTGLVSMTKTSGTATFTGAVNGSGLTINGLGGTLHLGATLSHIFTGNVTLSAGTLNGGSSVLNVNATSTTAWSGTGTNFTAGTGTVNFGGVGQTLATVTTFNNLTFSNSGVKTLTGLPTINGILSMEGTATVSVAPNYGAAATLQYNRTAAQATGLEWKTPFVATGGVRISNTGVISVNANKTFNATIPLNIQSGATLDNGGFSISGGATLTVANGGTLIVSGLSVFPAFTNTTLGTTSTVTYSGATQIVAVKNYGILMLTGSGNKTFAGAITILGELGISGSAVAIIPNGVTSSSQTLTFNGVLQSADSWGGSTSFATNKDALHFGSSTSGILNVSISCVSGTWLGVFSSDWNTAGNWCGGIVPSVVTDVIITTAPNQPNIGLTGGLCRNLSIDIGSNLVIAGSNTLTINGNWINNGTFTANSSTVVFNGTVAQSVGGTSVNVFNNLTNSNTSFPLDALSGITVNGILNTAANAILNMNSYELSAGGLFSNLGSGQIKTTSTVVNSIPSDKTWTNSIIYDTLSGGQTIVGGTYNGSPSLVLNNTSGIQIASGNISTANALNIDNGGSPTFSMNGYDLSVGILNITSANAVLDILEGAFSYTALADMEGTIRFSGATNGVPFVTGTVEYYGLGQTVTTGNYNNLLFSGAGGNYSIANDLDIENKLTVIDGALTIQDAISVAVGDAVTVTGLGSLTLENNASLVQTTFTGPNTGTIIVKRNTTPIINDDFTYWSSPTTSTQTLLDFSPNTQTDKFFKFENDWSLLDPSTSFFEPGIGYAIRSPEAISGPPIPPFAAAFQFEGIPNNGTIDIPVTVRVDDGLGERLVGNPYPSSIDADAFINANILDTGTLNQTITGTLYFWTHNHTLSGNDYLDTDYATYNLFGGVGVGSGTGNLTDPSQYIASGQGFFIENDQAGNVTFDNSMRVLSNNDNFYKQKAKKEEENHRIWLKLIKSNGDVSGTLVGFGPNSTSNYDPGFDSYIYSENHAFAIYSFLGTDQMAIQSKGLPIENTDTFSLGYSTDIAGNTSIDIDKVDGLFSEEQDIYIEDKLLNVIHNIKEDSYAFNSEAGTFNDRFILRFTSGSLGTKDLDLQANSVLMYYKNKELKIQSISENIKSVNVFDVLGRKIFDEKYIDTKEFVTSKVMIKNQIAIVKVVLENGKEVTKKVLF